MINQETFLRRLIASLEKSHIPYMLSGSYGSSFHGQPRATNDVDIVIDPTEKQLQTFLHSLGEDWYVSLDAAAEALRNNSMFNVIDIQSSWKADLIIRKDRPFSIEEFNRKRCVNIIGLDAWILSSEDVILSKLEWSKERQSERQFRDALGVAVVQWDALDVEYLNKWSKQLEIENLLKQLLDKARSFKEPER